LTLSKLTVDSLSRGSLFLFTGLRAAMTCIGLSQTTMTLLQLLKHESSTDAADSMQTDASEPLKPRRLRWLVTSDQAPLQGTPCNTLLLLEAAAARVISANLLQTGSQCTEAGFR